MTMAPRLLALRSKDDSGARGHFESCLAVREKLATQDKGNDRRQMELMLVLAQAEVRGRRVWNGGRCRLGSRSGIGVMYGFLT